MADGTGGSGVIVPQQEYWSWANISRPAVQSRVVNSFLIKSAPLQNNPSLHMVVQGGRCPAAPSTMCAPPGRAGLSGARCLPFESRGQETHWKISKTRSANTLPSEIRGCWTHWVGSRILHCWFNVTSPWWMRVSVFFFFLRLVWI